LPGFFLVCRGVSFHNLFYPHPLSDETIQQIRQCLGLISTRERELADEAGVPQERPYYTDEKPAADVVSISSITKKKKD